VTRQVSPTAGAPLSTATADDGPVTARKPAFGVPFTRYVAVNGVPLRLTSVNVVPSATAV